MQPLSTGHREQAKELLKDGKSVKEIVSFFKAQYNVEVTPGCLYMLKSSMRKDGLIAKRAEGPARQKKHKAAKKQQGKEDPVGGTADGIKSLIDQLFAELDAYCEFKIKQVRSELVKRVAEARKMRIEAGEDLEEIQEREEDNNAI